MRIGIIAGEMSGDLLGAGLMRELRQRFPEARFEGIGGPAMLEQGIHGLYPMEELSVMGLFEVLRHLPRLLGIRRALYRHFADNPPDVFIGIDSPDFNLGLEARLRAHGIRTVHYVSPTVWAWREGRIHGIKRSVDRMLTLFPFENEVYRRHGIPVTFVGHPAADRFPLQHDQAAHREALGLESEDRVVALLPGSRMGEVGRLGPIFAGAVARLLRDFPDCRFVAPMASPRVAQSFEAALTAAGVSDRVTLLERQSEHAMGAADVVLSASGTATLEAMLLQRPTVVAYRVSAVSYRLFRWLLKVRRIALPNLLADDDLMPEFIQHEATPERLADAVGRLLSDDTAAAAIRERCLAIHRQLRQGADARAAEAVAECLSQAS